MITRYAVGANGVALLAVGWAVGGGVWAAVAGVAGLLALGAVVARRGWAGAAVVVAVAFMAEVALAGSPDWALVLLGAVLLACFLALGELHENGVDVHGTGADARAAVRPHVVPVLACVAAAVIAIVAAVLPLDGDVVVVAASIAAAACVGVLILALPQQ